MSEHAPDSAASGKCTATTVTLKSSGAESIAAILKSSGPAVKCVLLRHIRSTGRDGKPHAVLSKLDLKTAVESVLSGSVGEEHPDLDQEAGSSTGSNVNEDEPSVPPELHMPRRREVLTELIQEMKIDTTPGERGVEKILGGSFTFLGQYPDESVVLMARADQFADLTDIDSLSVKELKALIQDSPDIVADAGNAALEKSDLIQAVKEAQLPLNPHILQPPFEDYAVRGDILLMRVADMPEDEDDDNYEGNDPQSAVSKAVDELSSAAAVSNEDFFLDYTMEEYIAFASRTDVVAPIYDENDDEESDDEHDLEEGEHKENGDSANGGEEDEDYVPGDTWNENDEDDRRILLNLILGEVIKSFRAENKRGPNSEELLHLRSEVAKKLGLELAPPIPTVPVTKRPAVSSPSAQSPFKRVKFSPDVAVRNLEDSDPNDDEDLDEDTRGDQDDEEEDRKIAAIPDGRSGKPNGEPLVDETP